MVGAQIDTADFIRELADTERRKIPAATLRALNQSAFEVRDRWAEEIPKVFDRPTALTLRAPLYRKATKEKLSAEVFIRDVTLGGTPPSEYLKPQAFGGTREQKRSEAALARYTGFPNFFVPAGSAPKDQYGNLARGVLQKILSQLQAYHDPAQRETEKKRGRRLKRERKRGGGGSYFVLKAKRGGLKPGIVYERITSAFGSAVRPILIGVQAAPKYRQRFDAFGLAQRLFKDRFETNFRTAMTLLTRGRS